MPTYTPPAQTDSEFTSPQAMEAYIVAKASALGVDPAAALAVAAHEGGSLPGAVGDHGTSFGPWQLHEGGALPAAVAAKGPTYANQWANSPAGVDYALGRIATVAKGLTGTQAVHAIVYQFERPANPGAEAAAATATYNQGGVPKLSGSGGITIDGYSIGDLTGVTAISNLLSGGAKGSPEATTLKTIDSVPKFLEFVTSWRFAEIVGGFFLLLVGLYLLGRQFGVTAPVGQAAKGAATVAFPEGRIAKAATATATAKARPEGRREEIHQARLKTEGARATELRTRTRHRAAMAKGTKAQREAEVRSAYIRGAADQEGFPRSA